MLSNMRRYDIVCTLFVLDESLKLVYYNQVTHILRQICDAPHGEEPHGCLK